MRVLRCRCQITALLAALALLAAAVVPCPPDDTPSQLVSASALAAHAAGHDPHELALEMPCHGPPEASLTAPCPCGCEKRSSNASAAKRLGPILLPEVAAGLPPATACVGFRLVQHAPTPFPSVPDPVPIIS